MSGYRSVPEPIWQKIQAFTTPFQVGISKNFSAADVASGLLGALGIDDAAAAAKTSTRAVPPSSAGRWSDWNVNGREVVRDDLPKVPRSYVTWIRPYGNRNATEVAAFTTREVFPRETRYGHGLAIQIDVGTLQGDKVRIGFRVDRVFPPDTKREDVDLLLALSLLRENVGAADIVPSGTTPDEWVSHQELSWELLPEGQRGDLVFESIVRRLSLDPDSDNTHVARARNEFIWSLGPGKGATGRGTFSRYVAYIFRDDLVVLENLSYGNALYVMYENWEALSQRSRLDLLADPQADFTRIVHRGRWKQELKKAIQGSRRRKT